jgi:predicted aconitase
MELALKEQQILDGERGPVLQKVMRTLVLYGKTLGADRLVDIEGDGHFACPFPVPGVGLRLEMLDELVGAGLKTKFPFTLDPKGPQDFENLALTPAQAQMFTERFRDQERYDERMEQLGLRDKDSYTCTPYLAQVGNIPKRGGIVAWSESSAVVFANSVLGARTNRNAVILDIFSNIVGKTPLVGLLTDEGRRATWLVNVETSRLPDPQLLGGAIGKKVLEDVPYIVGLDRFLGPGLSEESADYLKEMGAACAAIGAVGLYHVENITPEAVEQGTSFLVSDYKTYTIDDQELEDLMASYPVMWVDKESQPQRCLIGCPHVSLGELYWWTDSIHSALEEKGQSQVAIPTVIAAAAQVLHRFEEDQEAYQRLEKTGVRLSTMCAEAYMTNQLAASEAVVTDSNKLRAFTRARMFLDEDLLEIIVTGEIRGAP